MSVTTDLRIPTPSVFLRMDRIPPRISRRICVCFAVLIALLLTGMASPAQTVQPATPDYSINPKSFPHVLLPYKARSIPTLDPNNTKTLSQMIREGKIELSLSQLAAAVVENNLNIAVDRYNIYYSQTDLLRANAGQAARGVAGAGAGIPNELFSSAIGAGVGSLAGLGGIGLTGSVSGLQRTISISPRGAFDPTFLFNVSLDHTASPLNTLVVAGSPTVTTGTAFYQFGWQQAFTTGTSFSVQMSNQRQSSDQQFLIYNPDVISRMSLNVVQELMNGGGFGVNRRFQTVARNNLRIARKWFEQQVNTVLAQAMASYWDLVSAQEQVKAAEEALKASQQLYENNKKQVEFGILAPLDVVSAEAQAASSQRDLIVAQTNLQRAGLSLKTFFSKQITEALGDAEIVAIDPLPEPQDAELPSFEVARSVAEQNRPDLPQAQGAMINDQVAVKVTRNSLKPTFNVFGFLASAGLSGDRMVPNSAGGGAFLLQAGLAQELNQFIRFRYPEYAAGFSLTIPIRNRSALADNARANLDERQDEISLRRTYDQIGLDVHTAIVALIQSKEQVTSAQKAVDFSKQTLSAEQKRLAAGLSTSYNVILAQRNLLAAELAETQAGGAYAKALVGMDRAEGVLLEKNRIDLDDAIRGRISQ